MISASTQCHNKPFLLSPAGKDYLWGGKRLKEDFNKHIDMTPLAETWECSVHPDGPSVVASGEYKGQLLSDVVKAHPYLLGKRHEASGTIPILIKLIDASKDLSVQVHPDDDYAFKNENGQLGKTEMWYVLDTAKDTTIVYGLHHTIGKEELKNSIEDGSVEKYLQKVHINRGDQFLIQPGTIHAIGAGSLIAEIQENSNLTYRLYDYNRVDKNGQKRPLHIDKALEVANVDAISEPRQPMRLFKYATGCASEMLCRCKYFQVERLVINTEQCNNNPIIQTDDLSFKVLLCTEGFGSLSFEGENISVCKGNCFFIPACSVDIMIKGITEYIRIDC